jgi:hypothetical protein
VDDRLAGVVVEDAGGDDRRGRGAGQPDPALVDEEDTIGVAVEGEPDVGAHLEHPCTQVRLVLGLDGIGRVVGEGAVELPVHDLEVEGQWLEHGGDDQSTHAVRGVRDDLERAQRIDVDEGPHVGGERTEQVLRADGAVGRGVLDTTGERRLGDLADGTEPRVLAHRPSPRLTELDAVVLRRIVRRGEHRPRGVEGSCGEVQQVGGGQAEVDDIEALRAHAVRERRDHLDPRRPHVPGDEHPCGVGVAATDEAGEADPDGSGDGVVELLRHEPAHVVGLEDLIEVTHGGAP